MTLDPRQLRPSELCQLLNSTPMGEVIGERQLRRHRTRAVRHVVFDTNYWKSFVQSRLAVPMGDPGCLALFGRKPESHRLLAEHLMAEYRVKTEGRGRTVDEWKLRQPGLDNHWLDCIVGAAIAASMQGAMLYGTDQKPCPKHRVKLSDVRANRLRGT